MAEAASAPAPGRILNIEFSARTRAESLARLRGETFDYVVVGGGITGAATARDLASRGLSVALLEKGDFASATSSASSKLIHGGLRYLENFEFKLVFEALSERAHLVRTSPNMVRWLKFYWPVYRTDARGMGMMSIGLWLYELLALGRAPHFHRRFSRRNLARELPHLKANGLKGGFTYYDASMWDDVMVVENAREAARLGAAIGTRVEATQAIWERDAIVGFEALDHESGERFAVRAKRVVVCAGPYTDKVGEILRADPGERWTHWLKPSRGVHLLFDLKRFPMPGAMTMSHPKDGRIAFVIPRVDFGAGVVVVGTTDGPSPADPSQVRVEDSDIDYLLELLERYFPTLHLSRDDILSAYVGVRPLMDPAFGHDASGPANLQSVSREHHIGRGPGGSVLVAGGKYTTSRLIAREIADFALQAWQEDYYRDFAPRVSRWLSSKTDGPVNPAATPEGLRGMRRRLSANLPFLRSLVGRYAADAEAIVGDADSRLPDPEGFPKLEAQLRYALKHEMVLHLEDFWFRRLPLYLSRKDHAEPWIEPLSLVWKEGLGKTEEERQIEIRRLQEKIRIRNQGGVS